MAPAGRCQAASALAQQRAVRPRLGRSSRRRSGSNERSRKRLEPARTPPACVDTPRPFEPGTWIQLEIEWEALGHDRDRALEPRLQPSRSPARPSFLRREQHALRPPRSLASGACGRARPHTAGPPAPLRGLSAVVDRARASSKRRATNAPSRTNSASDLARDVVERLHPERPGDRGQRLGRACRR